MWTNTALFDLLRRKNYTKKVLYIDDYPSEMEGGKSECRILIAVNDCPERIHCMCLAGKCHRDDTADHHRERPKGSHIEEAMVKRVG